jgi:hypothetical protein
MQRRIYETPIESVTVSAVLKSSYRNLAHQGVVSHHVKNLEHEVANYDVTKAQEFNGGMEAFKVIFRRTNGWIVTMYANNGKIIRTTEKFKNIALPLAIRNAAYAEYPDYTFHGNNYFVSYQGENDISKLYYVQMSNDNEKKNLKIDMDGNILN